MAPPKRYSLTELDLSGTEYTVEQTGQDENFRPEYEARDVTGDTIFRVRYQMYEKRDEFPFVDADGTDICTVKAIETWDIAGDYLLTDPHTGEDLVILDNDLSPLRDTWRIRDAEDRSLLGEITSRGALISLGRAVLPLGKLIAHKYDVTDGEGESVGAIVGEFGLADQYEVSLRDTSSVPAEPIVIATVVIDAIRGN